MPLPELYYVLGLPRINISSGPTLKIEIFPRVYVGEYDISKNQHVSAAQRLPVRMPRWSKPKPEIEGNRSCPVDHCGRIVQYQVHLIDVHDAIEVRRGVLVGQKKKKKKRGNTGEGTIHSDFLLRMTSTTRKRDNTYKRSILLYMMIPNIKKSLHSIPV